MDAGIIVVGGGPVGSTLGLMMPEAVVLEAATFPRDKPCGEGLMPAGAAVLRALGVDLAAEGFPPLAGVRYTLADGETARASFAAGPGFGVRRTRLDALLAERAKVHCGVRVTAVRALEDRVEVDTSAGTVVGSALVAADGLHSPIARMLGWSRPARGLGRYGLVGHLAVEHPGEDIEVSLLGSVETYLAPVGPGEVLLAVLGTRGGLRAPGLTGEQSYRAVVQRAHPSLAEVPLLAPLSGAGPFHLRPARVAQGRVFLAGDAAGFLDPLTGDAMSAGLTQARALASFIDEGLEEAAVRYSRWMARQWRRRSLVASLARSLSGSGRVSRRALAGVRRRPQALQALLGVNDGSRSLLSVGVLDWAALLGVSRG
ncbi:MAG TPA: NAD(P)/FAD-dependent oxidoreductase [Candidatus Dormibacteraeota bacterium]|nr:NAD(P)/FAD-dependent oxidoreductase [Candidatus Dormibacteraeota bacterium]